MKIITCWNDLIPFGIEPLTGESCGLMYRLLCDLTVSGQRIIEKCLSVSLTPSPPWNCGSDADPHVGSVLLAPELLMPLGIFALLESGCVEVLRVNDWLHGIEPDDPPGTVAAVRAEFPQLRSFAYRGDAGDRNRHQMTGRVR